MTAMRFMTSVAGVMGYAKWYFTPQRARDSAKVSVFLQNSVSAIRTSNGAVRLSVFGLFFDAEIWYLIPQIHENKKLI
jgi:hypothetical protein